jgi:putative Mg2+ transporter-C (MgtC) family protein
MLLRLGAAAVLGGSIGLERERVESAAGLRTHAVVALGATLFMLVSMFGFSNAGVAPNVVLDPSRVAAQIVTGIGFLGAGVIIFRKEILRGLTTAASVWLVAAIGMAVGGGLYLAAIGTTVLGLAILAVMKPLEQRLAAGRRLYVISLVIDRRRLSLEDVRELLLASGARLERMDARLSNEPGKTRIDAVLREPSSNQTIALVEQLAAREGVREVRSTIHGAQREPRTRVVQR